MKLDVFGNKIQFKNGFITALHGVLEAREIEGKIVVIYDYMEFAKGRPARNMFAYNKAGLQLWRAEDIRMGATDAYTIICSEYPFKVGNFAGFNVLIDLNTGKVLDMIFTK